MTPRSPRELSADAPSAAQGRTRRRSTTYQRGDASRRRILDRAWEAFAERGFRGASMNEIARGAEITLAGLIFHFPNKIELFTAVIRERDSVDAEALRAAVGPEPGAFEMLDMFVATARSNVGRYPHVQLTHLNAAESAASPDHPGQEFAARHYAGARDLVADALRRSVERGEVRSDIDPDVIALRVVAMIEGLENQWLHAPHDVDLAGAFEDWVDELKTSLATPR